MSPASSASGQTWADAGGQVPSRRQVHHAAPVDLEHETHAQVGQRQRVQDLRDGPGLHTRAAQEPGSHGRVQEEVLHVHGRPGPAGGVLDPLHLPRERAQAGSRVLPLGRGFDDHPRHGGDRRERFPAEPQRVDVAQVFGVADLAGGVTVQTEQNISRTMPLPSSATTIRPFPPCSMATLTVLAPASSAFSTSSFTTEAGALHDLTGGDLVRHRVRQHPDPRAGGALRHGRGRAPCRLRRARDPPRGETHPPATRRNEPCSPRCPRPPAPATRPECGPPHEPHGHVGGFVAPSALRHGRQVGASVSIM